jgi:hypothetical protein
MIESALCMSMIFFYVSLLSDKKICSWSKPKMWILRSLFAGSIASVAWSVFYETELPYIFLTAIFGWGFYYHRYTLNGNQ